jgi:hypothetical protein
VLQKGVERCILRQTADPSLVLGFACGRIGMTNKWPGAYVSRSEAWASLNTRIIQFLKSGGSP